MNPFNQKLTVDSIFPELLMVVFQNLKHEDILTSRLVCKKWRDTIDWDMPLKVVVDDRENGNTLLAQRLKKKEIHITSFVGSSKEEGSALQSPRGANVLQKLYISGPVHHRFMEEVAQFKCLQELKIEGLALSLPLNLRGKFIFENLKILQLYSPYAKNEITKAELKKMVIPVAKNTTYFLKNIQCPQIRALMIDGDVDQMRIPEKYDWKAETLMSFLERYSRSLKKILIGESCIVGSRPWTKNNDSFPTSLRSLHCSFYGFQQKTAAFYTFLTSQRKLELLNLGALFCDQTWNILNSLPVTMRHLAIYWNSDSSPIFDCTVLTKLTNLERLELTYDGNIRKIFLNMLSLRACKKLKMLVSEQGGIPAVDVEELHVNFPDLKVLYLSWCNREGLEGLLEPQCGITFQGLKNMLSMRKLEYFYCNSADFLGDDDTVRKMIDLMSPFRSADHKGEKDIPFHVGMEPNMPDGIDLD